jgi:hypothetical protein
MRVEVDAAALAVAVGPVDGHITELLAGFKTIDMSPIIGRLELEKFTFSASVGEAIRRAIGPIDPASFRPFQGLETSIGAAEVLKGIASSIGAIDQIKLTNAFRMPSVEDYARSLPRIDAAAMALAVTSALKREGIARLDEVTRLVSDLNIDDYQVAEAPAAVQPPSTIWVLGLEKLSASDRLAVAEKLMVLVLWVIAARGDETVQQITDKLIAAVYLVSIVLILSQRPKP